MMLDEAANVMLTRPVKGSALKDWAFAVVRHRMLVDGSTFAPRGAAMAA
jgi:hypothetical protein